MDVLISILLVFLILDFFKCFFPFCEFVWASNKAPRQKNLQLLFVSHGVGLFFPFVYQYNNSLVLRFSRAGHSYKKIIVYLSVCKVENMGWDYGMSRDHLGYRTTRADRKEKTNFSKTKKAFEGSNHGIYPKAVSCPVLSLMAKGNGY